MILCKFNKKKEFIFEEKKNLYFYFLISVPEDPTCTSVIIDGATYQRLSHAAHLKPKQAREQEVEESKQNRDFIEVDFFLLKI